MARIDSLDKQTFLENALTVIGINSVNLVLFGTAMFYVVAEGWLLLDIGLFVVVFFICICVVSISTYLHTLNFIVR